MAVNQVVSRQETLIVVVLKMGEPGVERVKTVLGPPSMPPTIPKQNAVKMLLTVLAVVEKMVK